MSNLDTYYIRKVKIGRLFGHEQDVTLDFNEGVNCIYGANGSGKTTIINLLVAALGCDVDKFIKSRCETLTVYVAKRGQRRPIKFFHVEKKSDDQGSFDGLRYDFADQFIQGKLDSNLPAGQTRRLIRETLTVKHLPLYRYSEPETNDELLEERYSRSLNKNWRFDSHESENNLDPLGRMLLSLERQFKDEFAMKQRKIREDLELLKNKVLEKLLIDDALITKSREIRVKKNDIKSDDYKKAQQKLDDIGLRLPGDKLEKHFAAMIKASQDVFAKREEIVALQSNSIADAKKLNEVYVEHSAALKVYRSLDTLHNRFMSILSDVEKSTEFRVSTLKDFKQFGDMINSFFSNKSFEFSDAGEFRFKCGSVSIRMDELSSGEKHILALLGKVALATEERNTFIADEPELSLHLAWQRKLLPSLKNLAPSMQIIVATHTPAIIPSSANKIDLDELDYGAASV